MKHKLYLFLILCFWLVACSGARETPETTETPPVISDNTSAIQIAIATNDFAVGTPRLPFVLFDGPERVADVQEVKLVTFDLSKEPLEQGWMGLATNYSDYAVPYWVVYPEIPHAGLWGLNAEITLADGSETTAQFTIEVAEKTQAPGIGNTVPPSENRTLATVPDITKLTSGQNPNPAFYQMTVAEAVVTGQPSVIVFSTPAFCQTAICAPVLKSAEEVYQELGEQINFIHLEIYKAFTPTLVEADEIDEWQLTSEPWTFVLDVEGKVFARLGGPVSAQELTAVLQELLQSE